MNSIGGVPSLVRPGASSRHGDACRKARASSLFTLALLVVLPFLPAHNAASQETKEVEAAKAKQWTAIDLRPLGSGIHHAVMKFEGQKAPYPQYDPTKIIHIAETILAYQNGDGGWQANVDWTRIFSDEELASLPHGQQGKTAKKSTLDNDNTWSQVGYLAQVYRQAHLRRYADAALKGIDYILREQRPSGGWRGSDVDAITFNDNVMVGVLETLKTISENRDLYDFVDEARRTNARNAYDKGIRCILDCQIKVNGRLTAWCEQHDHVTRAPIWARTFEPPSITPDESVGVVRLLMSIPNPSPEVVTAVQSAVAWFDKVKIAGLKIDRVPAEPVTFQRHYSDYDCVEVKDPAAPPIWARYYDLETEQPIFCNRERKLTTHFGEVDRERRTGMPWYGYWPAPLLEKEYPAWQEKCVAFSDVPRLYVIGDSTASAYPADRSPRMGWAQALQAYFDKGRLVVFDEARSGRSAKSFYDEGAWNPIAERLRKQDYVFIQFGHNDSKKDDPKRSTDPDTTYTEYLKKYVGETQAKGASPVLLTSINRNSWNADGTLKDTLGDYPPAVRKLSGELHLPLIDLHKMTRKLYEDLGPEKAKNLFMILEKGASPNYPDGITDNTHLQENGANEICKLVVAAIEEQDLPLSQFVQVPGETSGRKAVVTITDGDACEPISSEQSNLSGTLEVRFAGRIKPHENTVCNVIGAGVKAIEGKFDRVQLPDGWLCDVNYDYGKPAVTLSNFRPDHAPAFPGVEGFGKYTIGGRGGKVYEVTNLNDKGPGSFREACEAKGPRTVVFRVSGTIPLESELKVKNPNITIAGQTAPGDGICIKNYQFNFDADEVIIRYMRFRPGDEKGKEQDAFGGKGDQIVIDHCSVSWGVDETLSINKGSNLSVQWCLVSESLTKSLHKKGSHGYGGLWGGPGGSWHHNVLAHHSSRNPRASGNEESGLIDVRNNVIYNWGFNSAYGGEMWPRNWINNYYKFGPATSKNVRHRIFLQKDPRGKMYCAGNYVRGFPWISHNNWAGGIDFDKEGEATEKTLRVDEPFVVAPVTTQPAKKAYKLVLKNVGCSLKRDPVDTRVIEEIRTGTAKYGETYGGGGKGLIDSQAAVGGWPELRSLPAPDDSDHDGMPDAWESEHGLNPSDPADGAQFGGDGYTHLEQYLNSLVPSN